MTYFRETLKIGAMQRYQEQVIETTNHLKIAMARRPKDVIYIDYLTNRINALTDFIKYINEFK